MRRSAMSLALGFLACSVALRAQQQWTAAESGSTRVITNASTDSATRLLAELSQARAMLARVTSIHQSMPLRVFAFQDGRSLGEVAPPQARRGDIHTFGFSLTGAHDAFIALRTDRPEPMVRATLRHEYIHALSAMQEPDAPAWLDEGLSEFWGSLEAGDNRIVAGRPIQEHITYLRTHKWLPLEAVMKQPRGSLPSDPANVRAFYAQSWLMVHYLLLVAHQGGTPVFIPQTTALPNQFETLLRQYVAGDLREVTVPWTAPAPSPARVSTITEAKAMAERAKLLVSTERADAGLVMARHALKADPNEPLALEVIGTYYFRNNSPDQAREWLSRALNAGADSYGAALYMSLLSTSTADQARFLSSALRARPDSELAWQRLGALWCRSFFTGWLWFGVVVPCA